MPEEIFFFVDSTLRHGDDSKTEYPAQSDEYARRDFGVQTTDRMPRCQAYEINPSRIASKSIIANGDGVKNR